MQEGNADVKLAVLEEKVLNMGDVVTKLDATIEKMMPAPPTTGRQGEHPTCPSCGMGHFSPSSCSYSTRINDRFCLVLCFTVWVTKHG